MDAETAAMPYPFPLRRDPNAPAPGSPQDQLQAAQAQQLAATKMAPNTSGLATALNAMSGYVGGRQEAHVLAANPSLATANQPSPDLITQIMKLGSNDPSMPMQLPGALPPTDPNSQDPSASNGGLSGMLGRKSDRRLKSDVSRIGTLPNGLPIYRYRLEDGPFEIGVMADEVAIIRPDATWIDPDDGFARVDYSMLVA